jgi:hypothetical protein
MAEQTATKSRSRGNSPRPSTDRPKAPTQSSCFDPQQNAAVDPEMEEEYIACFKVVQHLSPLVNQFLDLEADLVLGSEIFCAKSPDCQESFLKEWVQARASTRFRKSRRALVELHASCGVTEYKRIDTTLIELDYLAEEVLREYGPLLQKFYRADPLKGTPRRPAGFLVKVSYRVLS